MYYIHFLVRTYLNDVFKRSLSGDKNVKQKYLTSCRINGVYGNIF